MTTQDMVQKIKDQEEQVKRAKANFESMPTNYSLLAYMNAEKVLAALLNQKVDS